MSLYCKMYECNHEVFNLLRHCAQAKLNYIHSAPESSAQVMQCIDLKHVSDKQALAVRRKHAPAFFSLRTCACNLTAASSAFMIM